MKKLLILLLIPLTTLCQINIKNQPNNEIEYSILIDKEIALKHKDSLVNIGWAFQEKFPFFYKTIS